jgi:hypothetical protein
MVQPGRIVTQLPLERGEGVLILIPNGEVITAAMVGHHKEEEAENEKGGD